MDGIGRILLLPMFHQKGLYMKNNISNEEAKAIVDIHRLLKDCIIFDNIEGREFISRNLNLIKDYKEDVSEEMYSAVESFINDEIKPIVYDTNYFDFMIHEEFGDYNEDGHFVINAKVNIKM